MNRDFVVSILVLCFGLSSVDAARATQIIDAPPIIVQPYGIQSLNQQTLDQDRQNRDEEIEIQQLIEQNNKLTQDTLAHEDDEGLAKINQTMLSYRNALLSRDKARIIANSEKWWGSRYGDLVALTEDADDMTVHRDLVEKSDMLAQKYQMLTDLKDEMTALNDKLSGQGTDALNQKQTIIDGYKKVAQDQQDKIQMLVGRLDELDKKIAHFDDIIAEKDHQISQLKNDLASVRGEVTIKDSVIDDQKGQIAVLQEQSKNIAANNSQVDHLSQQLSQKQNQLDLLKSELENRITQKDNQGQETSVTQGQVDLLKEELENKITEFQKLGQEASAKDEMIKQQENQIAILQQQAKSQTNQMENISQQTDHQQVTPDADQNEEIDLLKNEIQQQSEDLKAKNKLIKSQADQMEILSKQTNNQNASSGAPQTQAIDFLKDQIQQQADVLKAKDKLIKSQTELMEHLSQQINNHTAPSGSDEVNFLKDQLQQQSDDLKAKDRLIKSQSDQMAVLSGQLQSQSSAFGMIQSKIASLKVRIKNQMNAQSDELKAKDESIRWLNQVLAATKNKSDYFKLTAQQEQLSLQQVQQEVEQVKGDFSQRFAALTKKQQQVDLLKEELENKITELKNQGLEGTQVQQDLRAQLQDKENQIEKMKADIVSILQAQAKDDRVKLAQQLIGLQEQEAALLDEKSTLALQQYDIFDRHYAAFENKMNILIANHQIQDVDLRDSLDALKNDLTQKQQEIDTLKAQIEEKIANEKNQGLLVMQIQDLKAQLQDREDQITSIKTTIQSGQGTTDTLRQQLADEQNKADQLKQELEAKNAQSGPMTVMLSDYQKKLESKDNAYNEQLGQIADLNARLQRKEAQVIKIKRDMYDLQEMTRVGDRNAQVKDLSLSMMQLKVMDDKVKGYQDKISALQSTNGQQAQEITSLKTDLALARQELKSVPSSDEIEFLRTGLKQATLQLKEKNELLLQTKANADEYEKEYKEQSQEFQSLKTQLQEAYDDLSRRNEDLKYKNLEVIRLKEREAIKEGDLEDQVKALTLKLDGIQKGFQGKIHGNKVEVLQAQLMSADEQIKELRTQLDQFILPSKGDPVRAKLKQALDKIDELGRVISIMSQKLQDCGQSAKVTQ